MPFGKSGVYAIDRFDLAECHAVVDQCLRARRPNRIRI